VQYKNTFAVDCSHAQGILGASRSCITDMAAAEDPPVESSSSASIPGLLGCALPFAADAIDVLAKHNGWLILQDA
jgi:hypothetical protein